MYNRFLKWCITEKGRHVVSYVATGAIGVVGIGHFIPQTICLDAYTNFLHRYRKGFTVPLSKEIKEKFEKVLDLLEVSDKDKTLYKPFNVVGFDVVNIGSSYSKYGVRIGIPGNFEYKSEADVDTSRITLGGEKVVWGTEEGMKLLKSLIISENAQLFALAREIKMADTPKLFIDTLAGITCSFAAYTMSRTINGQFQYYAKPLIFRLIVYTLVSTFALGNYFLIKDSTQMYYEQKIDKELKEKNAIFAEGGKEYYSKLLLRNMCYRIILGKDGESMYSPLGNINYFIRTKSTPLMQRREFFE